MFEFKVLSLADVYLDTVLESTAVWTELRGRSGQGEGYRKDNQKKPTS